MRSHVRLVPVALLALAATTACSRRRPPVDDHSTITESTADAERARRDSIARAEADRRAAEERDRLERARREREDAARRDAEGVRRTIETSVHFDFDRFDLSAEARATLDAKIPALRSAPSMRIRIVGHADERGSDEYNLALGQRRAAAAKRYLTQRDVDGGRIEVSSAGEERPACSSSNESCWSQNRRDEFTIVAGGPVAARP